MREIQVYASEFGAVYELLQTFERTAFLQGPTAVVAPWLACISCLCCTQQPQSNIKVRTY